jgi:DNA-binding transcriptional regulator YhcF (GntR family)
MLKVNLNSPVPIYEQLVGEIKRMIEEKELEPGESLPTIRALASQLDVAVNTVARAYQELEKLAMIESRGRRGSFVRDKLPDGSTEQGKIFKEPILKLLQRGKNRKEIEYIFKNNLSQIFD